MTNHCFMILTLFTVTRMLYFNIFLLSSEHSLQNYYKILKECFHGTTCIVICLASLNLLPHIHREMAKYHSIPKDRYELYFTEFFFKL